MRGPVVALGAPEDLAGFSMAGAMVLPASNPEEVRNTWAALPPGTALVILTRNAAAALPGIEETTRGPLVAVLP